MNLLITGIAGEISYKLGESEFKLVDISYEQSLTGKVEFKEEYILDDN